MRSLEVSTDPGEVLHDYIGAFVNGLVESGLRHVCLAPGSRSTPLALEVWRHPDISVWVHLDERSCGYFALGMAKVSGEPVGLISTSGTAAVNFAPAVVEASQSHIPLILLTADRPPELRAIHASQTIDQLRLYGSHVKRFIEMSTASHSASMLRYASYWGKRVVVDATSTPNGPVHCNFPLRDPLIPVKSSEETIDSKSDQRWLLPNSRDQSKSIDIAGQVGWFQKYRRGLIICGPDLPARFASRIAAVAFKLGFPILADPLSQVRCGDHDRSMIVDCYDIMLRSSAVAQRLRPDFVLRFGLPPTSKPLTDFLDTSDAEQLLVIGDGDWNDPSLVALAAIFSDPVDFCDAVLDTIQEGRLDPSNEWLNFWMVLREEVWKSIETYFTSDETLSEPRLITEIADLIDDKTLVFAGNSMPVRDLDSFYRKSPQKVRFLANRGANGIDGIISTALGAAAVSGQPMVLVIGDLSFYHDMNGLLAASKWKINATIIVVNNDGGGIFSFLPQLEQIPEFESLFGTPHGLEFSEASALYDLPYSNVVKIDNFREVVAKSIQLDGTQIIEVKSSRDVNLQQHRSLWEFVSARLCALMEKSPDLLIDS